MKSVRTVVLVWICSLFLGFSLFQWGGAQNTAVTPREGQKLLYQFRKAQAEERRDLLSRQRSQFREMRAAQDLRFREWNQRENAARREYFQGHIGSEKRAYMRDLKLRRQTFEKLLKDERATRVHENEVRMKAIEEDQKARLGRFREFLSRGEDPPRDLWPQN